MKKKPNLTVILGFALAVIAGAVLFGGPVISRPPPVGICVVTQDFSSSNRQVFLVFRLWPDGTVDCNSVGEEDIGNCPAIIEPECFAGWKVIH